MADDDGYSVDDETSNDLRQVFDHFATYGSLSRPAPDGAAVLNSLRFRKLLRAGRLDDCEPFPDYFFVQVSVNDPGGEHGTAEPHVDFGGFLECLGHIAVARFPDLPFEAATDQLLVRHILPAVEQSIVDARASPPAVAGGRGNVDLAGGAGSAGGGGSANGGGSYDNYANGDGFGRGGGSGGGGGGGGGVGAGGRGVAASIGMPSAHMSGSTVAPGATYSPSHLVGGGASSDHDGGRSANGANGANGEAGAGDSLVDPKQTSTAGKSTAWGGSAFATVPPKTVKTVTSPTKGRRRRRRHTVGTGSMLSDHGGRPTSVRSMPSFEREKSMGERISPGDTAAHGSSGRDRLDSWLSGGSFTESQSGMAEGDTEAARLAARLASDDVRVEAAFGGVLEDADDDRAVTASQPYAGWVGEGVYLDDRTATVLRGILREYVTLDTEDVSSATQNMRQVVRLFPS